jgi:hypothetical protein
MGHDPAAVDVCQRREGGSRKATEMDPSKGAAEGFLKARPRMNTETGSRELAVALQRAFSASSADERDAVLAAMLKAGSGTVARTSLSKFAEELPQTVRRQFLHGVEPEVSRSVFQIDRDVLKANLSRYIVTTTDGVIISAPSEVVGKVLDVRERGAARVVKYEGEITTGE